MTINLIGMPPLEIDPESTDCKFCSCSYQKREGVNICPNCGKPHVTVNDLRWEYNGENAVWATFCDIGGNRSDFTPPDIFVCRLDAPKNQKDLAIHDMMNRCPEDKKSVGKLIENAGNLLRHLKLITEVLESIMPYEFNGQHPYFDEFNDDYQEGIEALIEKSNNIISKVES